MPSPYILAVLWMWQLFTMLADWPHQESSALRYVPEDIQAWQAARNASGASGYAYHVPSCVHMHLVYIRNIHLRVAVSSVAPEKVWGFADWATVSVLMLCYRATVHAVIVPLCML